MAEKEPLKRQGDFGTFIISISDFQNGTWQGELHWVDENKTQYFRSVLELLKLMDGALQFPE